MKKLIWLIIISAVIIIVTKLLNKKVEATSVYVKKEYFLNIPERKFFEVLQKILPNEYVCYPQILISSILSIKKGEKDFWKYHNKINRKTIDFVIFKKQYLEPILAIEYDGSSHNRPDRKKRDEFVNEIMENANLDIVHIKHGKDDLKNVITTKILTKLQK